MDLTLWQVSLVTPQVGTSLLVRLRAIAHEYSGLKSRHLRSGVTPSQTSRTFSLLFDGGCLSQLYEGQARPDGSISPRASTILYHFTLSSAAISCAKELHSAGSGNIPMATPFSQKDQASRSRRISDQLNLDLKEKNLPSTLDERT